MATMYSTGPILVWAGPQFFTPAATSAYAASGAPGSLPILFLGTAEQTPQAEIRRQYQPAYNDLGGAVPFDLSFLGADAIFACDLTRWDETVYRMLAREPGQIFGIPGTNRGRWGALNGLGSLQAHDGFTTTLYVVFPYGLTAAAVGSAGRGFGMPGGYRFHGGSVINDKLHQMGSRHRKLHLTFQFAPVMDVTSPTFMMNLYDHTIPPALARPPATPQAPGPDGAG